MKLQTPSLTLAALLGFVLVVTASAKENNPAQNYFGNTELVNQKGETMRFYNDLVADKIVVIDTIFTTCTGVCPVMSKTFQKIQERVGERLGEDVHLISISLDPETDTPERLQEYAARFGAREGWYFLTGEQAEVEDVLKRLGQYVEVKETHQAIILVGNDRTGLWKKAYGLAPSEEVLEVVDSVLTDRGP